MRSIALGKVLQTYGKVHILTNSPYADFVSPLFPNLTIHLVPYLSIPNLVNAYGKLLDEQQISYLIVDTFPRGILGELVDILPKLTIPKILLVRDLHPNYVREYELEKFIDLNYNLCIPIEKIEFSNQPSIACPVTICGAQEILTPNQAQKVLGISELDRKNVLICASGTPTEMKLFQGLYWELQELLPRYMPNCNIFLANYFPAMALYSTIDLVIGGGGYNTVGECLAMNLPLLGIPFSRRYDRQVLRLKRYENRGIYLIENISQVLPQISKVLHSQNSKSAPISFMNGANQVIDRLFDFCTPRQTE